MLNKSWSKLLVPGMMLLLMGINAEGGMSLTMPGKSYQDKLPALSETETVLSKELKNHVRYLAETVGERNLLHYDNLNKAVEYITAQLNSSGCKLETQEYKVPAGFLSRKWQDKHYEQQVYKNIVAEIKGTDTMIQTAQALAGIPGKVIVLVGSMQPARFKTSDAVFNIGFAAAAVQTLPPGVYITMNGRVFNPSRSRKNVEMNRFEEL